MSEHATRTSGHAHSDRPRRVKKSSRSGRHTDKPRRRNRSSSSNTAAVDSSTKDNRRKSTTAVEESLDTRSNTPTPPDNAASSRPHAHSDAPMRISSTPVARSQTASTRSQRQPRRATTVEQLASVAPDMFADPRAPPLGPDAVEDRIKRNLLELGSAPSSRAASSSSLAATDVDHVDNAVHRALRRQQNRAGSTALAVDAKRSPLAVRSASEDLTGMPVGSAPAGSLMVEPAVVPSEEFVSRRSSPPPKSSSNLFLE